MGKTRTISLLPVFRTLLFFVSSICIVSLLFLLSVGQAAPIGEEMTPQEIAREYGQAVVSITAYDKDDQVVGNGSGFIVDPEGVVVTNYHCISGAYSVGLRIAKGHRYVPTVVEEYGLSKIVEVLGVDQDRDIAVLKMHGKKYSVTEGQNVPKNLPTAPLGDSDKLSVGERVVVIGNPLGLENTVSEGIISAIRRRKETGGVLIQFTAPVSPGSSGGPVFNKKGEVIGITTMQMKEGQNLNFAVPINRAKPLLKNKNPIALAEAAPPPVPALTEKDTNPEALQHFILGAMYADKGLYDLAIRQYEEAIRLKPDFADAYNNLGVVYGRKGLYDLEIRQYEEAIRLKPDYADAYYNLGVVYADKGLYDLAIRRIETAVLMKPDLGREAFLDELYRLRGR